MRKSVIKKAIPTIILWLVVITLFVLFAFCILNTTIDVREVEGAELDACRLHMAVAGGHPSRVTEVSVTRSRGWVHVNYAGKPSQARTIISFPQENSSRSDQYWIDKADNLWTEEICGEQNR